jgi:transposase
LPTGPAHIDYVVTVHDAAVVILSGGQQQAFEPVMAGIRIRRRGPGRPRTRPGRVLGDKAYSSRAIRSYLRRRRIVATIPEPADQARNRVRRGRSAGRPPAFDPDSYKQRNIVERAINKLKGHRGVATRYDKRDYMFRGTVDVASIKICCVTPSHDPGAGSSRGTGCQRGRQR